MVPTGSSVRLFWETEAGGGSMLVTGDFPVLGGGAGLYPVIKPTSQLCNFFCMSQV